MTLWTTPYALLREEMLQRRDEGVDVPPALRSRIDALDPQADPWNESTIWGLYDELAALSVDIALAAREPDDFAAIRRLRPYGPATSAGRPARPSSSTGSTAHSPGAPPAVRWANPSSSSDSASTAVA